MKLVAQPAVMCPMFNSIVFVKDCRTKNCPLFRQINTNLDGKVSVICGKKAN